MKKEIVYVTGASGLLGNHLIRRLLDKGYYVRALIEPGTISKSLEESDKVAFVYGSVLNSSFIKSSTRGCDFIIHAAASTEINPARNPIVTTVNVLGTKNIIAAAIINKIKRLVHVGSANSFGYGPMNNPGNEKKPFNGFKFGLDYIDSKYQAQQEVLEAVKIYDLDAIVVCPTFMLGKYDSKPGSGALVASIYNRSIPGYSKGGKNYVHVNDVAIAIVNGLELGQKGECYILGNLNLNYKDAFRLISKVVGVRPPLMPLPKWLCIIYGLTNELACKLLRKKPKVTYAIAKLGNEDFYYDSSKSINELYLPQTPIHQAIEESFLWMKENKIISSTPIRLK